MHGLARSNGTVASLTNIILIAPALGHSFDRDELEYKHTINIDVTIYGITCMGGTCTVQRGDNIHRGGTFFTNEY